MIEIEPVLASLGKRRPIFHSEADLQHELAHELRAHDPDLALRLEYPIGIDSRASLDILLRKGAPRFGLELKYLCRSVQTTIDDEIFALKHQSAHDIRRYDVVIDAAFRAMMRRYHPDTFAGPKAEAERRAKQLNEAFAVLRNPERRRAYDETRGPAAPPPPPVYEILPNPDARRAVPRAALALGAAAAVAALAFIYLNRPSAPDPAAPVATTEAAALPIAPQPTPTPTAEPSPTPTALAGCRGMDCRVMTPFGWGGIEAGVTTDSAQAASGMKIRDDGHYTDAGDGSCLAFEAIGGPKNLKMLVESGLSRPSRPRSIRRRRCS